MAALRVEISTPRTTSSVTCATKRLRRAAAEGRPDEPLGNAGVGRSEGVQVRIGLPLLEQEFNLPSETVEFADGGEIEVLAR